MEEVGEGCCCCFGCCCCCFAETESSTASSGPVQQSTAEVPPGLGHVGEASGGVQIEMRKRQIELKEIKYPTRAQTTHISHHQANIKQTDKQVQ